MKKPLLRIVASFLVLGGIIFPGLNVSANQDVTTSAVQFNDVSNSYTFYDEIMYLSGSNVISGFTDGTFRPDSIVTRAQAAIMIGKALEFNGEPRNTNFTDVTSTITGSGYIASAVERGIISGFSDGTFRPNQPVTRGQMAIFLNRAFTLTAGNTNSFTDVSSNMAAYQAIINVSSNGIASGYTDGTYHPEQQVNRGQFSGFMARTLEPSFRIIPVIPPKLEVSGLTDGLVTEIDTHQLSVETDEGASVTVTLNGNIVSGEHNVYEISFSNPGKNIIVVTAVLNGATAKKQITVTYKPDTADLSTSEIAQLNDDKVVMIVVNTRDGGSQGSGVIVGNGLILTNEHVIDGMIDGIVTLNDGTEYELSGIVVSDQTKDLALVKTTTEIANREPVEIGTYTSLAKGDKVVAIGSPLGLQNTVSEGIVSSFREYNGVKQIQISAPIDHGSSGGGLFNTKGELIGITSSGYDGSNAELNFAIAIDEAGSWNDYFNMAFGDIKVKESEIILPPTGTLPIPGLGNIALGMTKEQVKNTEASTLLYEDSTSLMYTNKRIFDYSASVTYQFENNKLVSITIFHDVLDKNNDLEVLEAYFYVMYDNLSKIYGNPVSLDTNWYNDNDGYSLSALWFTGSQDIFLAAKVNTDYSSFGGILISSR